MNTLAQRLKYARELANLSQQEVAKRANISQPTYFKIENGSTLKPRNILEIAQALTVNAHWLATGEGEMVGNDSPVKHRRSDSLRLIPDFATDGTVINHRDSHSPQINHNSLLCRQVPDESMDPFFKQGDFVFADKTLTPQTGGYVIARLASGFEVIRRYKEYQDPVLGENQKELVAESSFFPVIKFSETPFEILGTIFEHKRFMGQGLQWYLNKQAIGNEVARLVAEALGRQTG